MVYKFISIAGISIDLRVRTDYVEIRESLYYELEESSYIIKIDIFLALVLEHLRPESSSGN